MIRLSSLTNLLISLLLLGCSKDHTSKPVSEKEATMIKKEVMQLAGKWIDAWNGSIDSDNMMANYHPDMKYIWRGISPPGDYKGFKSFAEEMLVPNANYNLSMSNEDITIIDENNAIVFFHFKDKNEDPFGSGAASLVMTKRNDEWKIIYVHESSVLEMD